MEVFLRRQADCRIVTSLLFLPLDESLVLATNGEEAIAFGSESSTYDVLTMTSVAGRCMAVIDDGVVPHVDQAPIIAGN